MKETQEIILAALTKITDEKAERTPFVITYPKSWDDVGMMFLALTPSQIGLLDILFNNDLLSEEVTVQMLTEINWEMP